MAGLRIKTESEFRRPCCGFRIGALAELDAAASSATRITGRETGGTAPGRADSGRLSRRLVLAGYCPPPPGARQFRPLLIGLNIVQPSTTMVDQFKFRLCISY